MDLMTRRRALLAQMIKNPGILPSGYTQIKYVYCDGSYPHVVMDDYLDINEMILWVKVSRDTDDTAEGGFCGNSGYEGSEYEIYYVSGATKLLNVWPGVYASLIGAIYGNEYDEVTVKINRSTGGARLVGRFRPSQYRFKGKIWEYTESDMNGNILHHLYPCVSPSNVVGFYCTETNRFFAPASSSVFIAGPIVN